MQRAASANPSVRQRQAARAAAKRAASQQQRAGVSTTEFIYDATSTLGSGNRVAQALLQEVGQAGQRYMRARLMLQNGCRANE